LKEKLKNGRAGEIERNDLAFLPYNDLMDDDVVLNLVDMRHNARIYNNFEDTVNSLDEKLLAEAFVEAQSCFARNEDNLAEDQRPPQRRTAGEHRRILRKAVFEETVAKLDAEERGSRLVEEELAVERLEEAVAGERATHARERQLLEHEAHAALTQIRTNEERAEMLRAQAASLERQNILALAVRGIQNKLTAELGAQAESLEREKVLARDELHHERRLLRAEATEAMTLYEEARGEMQVDAENRAQQFAGREQQLRQHEAYLEGRLRTQEAAAETNLRAQEAAAETRLRNQEADFERRLRLREATLEQQAATLRNEAAEMREETAPTPHHRRSDVSPNAASH
jgi:hypothetical protein